MWYYALCAVHLGALPWRSLVVPWSSFCTALTWTIVGGLVATGMLPASRTILEQLGTVQCVHYAVESASGVTKQRLLHHVVGGGIVYALFDVSEQTWATYATFFWTFAIVINAGSLLVKTVALRRAIWPSTKYDVVEDLLVRINVPWIYTCYFIEFPTLLYGFTFRNMLYRFILVVQAVIDVQWFVNVNNARRRYELKRVEYLYK